MNSENIYILGKKQTTDYLDLKISLVPSQQESSFPESLQGHGWGEIQYAEELGVVCLFLCTSPSSR